MDKSLDLEGKIKAAHDHLRSCVLCPRNCGVDRLNGETGYCKTGKYAVIASYGPHFGEEQPLVGKNGSGTIFFGGCNLSCRFCQNYDISHEVRNGREVDQSTLATVMLELQGQGCHNINFVTPTHVVPQILGAYRHARDRGLDVPLVYNCGGYEKTETLKLLDGVISIYMPDFKFWDETSSTSYSDAPNYPAHARDALREMHRQVGDLRLNSRGIAEQGLLVRHLIMPNGIKESDKIIEFIATEISRQTYLNLMDQYRPCGTINDFPELNRSLTKEEYQAALQSAHTHNMQRLDSNDFRLLLKRLINLDD